MLEREIGGKGEIGEMGIERGRERCREKREIRETAVQEFLHYIFTFSVSTLIHKLGLLLIICHTLNKSSFLKD